jgi:hypothetical protein
MTRGRALTQLHRWPVPLIGVMANTVLWTAGLVLGGLLGPRESLATNLLAAGAWISFTLPVVAVVWPFVFPTRTYRRLWDALALLTSLVSCGLLLSLTTLA